jgi:hypothetical protein
MKIGLALIGCILILQLVEFIIRERRRKKEVNKKDCNKTITFIESNLNEQMVKSKIFEDRLDVFQVSLSKTMSDMRKEIDKIKDNKITASSEYINNKELADLTFQWGINKLKSAEQIQRKRNTYNKHSFSKIQLHKEILKKTGKQWFVIRKELGQSAYQKELRKAYARLSYNKRKNK